MKNRWFFGWSNIKWFLNEIMNIYSSKPSFFSKKRIESSIAFIIAQIGMIWYLKKHISELTTSDIVLWSTVEFAIAGYMITQIQKEKKKPDSEIIENSDSEN